MLKAELLQGNYLHALPVPAKHHEQGISCQCLSPKYVLFDSRYRFRLDYGPVEETKFELSFN